MAKANPWSLINCSMAYHHKLSGFVICMQSSQPIILEVLLPHEDMDKTHTVRLQMWSGLTKRGFRLSKNGPFFEAHMRCTEKVFSIIY